MSTKNTLEALDAAERAYLLDRGWKELPPQNVMHEPLWIWGTRKLGVTRATAIKTQRKADEMKRAPR